MSPSVPHSVAPSAVNPAHLEAYCARGIERCRRGDWDSGIQDLMSVAGQAQKKDLPSLVFSYLGLGIAQHRSEIKEGLRLCQHAVKMEFFQPDNYYNLARVHLIAQQRGDAVGAVRKGLGIDPDHAGLQRLQVRLGIRQRQVIPFLQRTNPLNQILGRIRHQMRNRSAVAAAAARQKAEARRSAARAQTG